MEKSKAMKRDSIATAKVLSDALPHMQRHDGSIIVIKLGGHAMSSDAAMASFARDVGPNTSMQREPRDCTWWWPND
jgi:acetylglutamate kinase